MGSLKRLGPSCCAVLLGLFSGACQRDLEGDAGLDSGLDAGCGAVGFTYAQNVIVDAVAGVDDTKCACGSPAHPCKSLTYCMQLIAEGAVQNVTLHAQMSDGGPEWPVDLEPWPVHLGWGVTLEAPELYFNGPPIDGGPPLLYVYSYDAGDQSAVTIEGDPTEAGRYIHLGIPVADIGVTSTFTAITDPAPDPGTVHYFGGLPLVLQNAWLQGGEAALAVNDGASVQLGPLPVHFGTNGWQKNLENTQTAISCNGSYGAPPQIFDTGIAPVQIDDANLAISTGGSTCNISLTHGPRIGSQPQAIFDGGCSPFEQWAIGLTFGVHVTL
jgi:hypothetical protein